MSGSTDVLCSYRTRHFCFNSNIVSTSVPSNCAPRPTLLYTFHQSQESSYLWSHPRHLILFGLVAALHINGRLRLSGMVPPQWQFPRGCLDTVYSAWYSWGESCGSKWNPASVKGRSVSSKDLYPGHVGVWLLESDAIPCIITSGGIGCVIFRYSRGVLSY